MRIFAVSVAALAFCNLRESDAFTRHTPLLIGKHTQISFNPSLQNQSHTFSLRMPNETYLSKQFTNARQGGSLDMFSSQFVTTLVPTIGILTTSLLYLSPMTAVRSASKERSLGDLNPIPLAIMAVSSVCWLVYGLSIRDHYVTLSNVPGSIAGIYYVTSVLPLVQGKQLKTTRRIILGLSTITINLWTWLSVTNKTIPDVSSVLGSFASALFIILSGSPLSTIKKVITTRNSASILTQMTAAQVLDTTLWSAYGLAIKDKFVWGPCAVGLCFGLIQLVLKILFPSKRFSIQK